jgi:nucleotide-binding universal stress UspA family protein
MMPIRTILHPTDFSKRSEAALQLAASLARGYGARLIILHVAPCEITAGSMAVPMDPSAHWGALEALRGRVGGSAPELPVETCLREGDPADEILRAADDTGCDLIVMGSHGRSGLARILMGSVAEAALRRAGCPVLLAKGPLVADASAEQGDEAARCVGAGPEAGDRPAYPPSDRVRVSNGRCGCGVITAHVHHRDFPELWAEGGSPAEAAANLSGRLAQARECCSAGWPRDELSRAIADVHAFRTGLDESDGGRTAAREDEGGIRTSPLGSATP